MGTQVAVTSDGGVQALPGVAWVAGLGTAALGGAALIGWAVGSRFLKQLVPGPPSTCPAAAVCLILLGIAVITLVRRPRGQWFGAAAAVAAGLIAGVSVLEYALDRDLLVDHVLFGEAVDREPHGGRMALATAVGLLLMVSAVLAAFRGKRRVAQGLALLAFAGGAVAVLGYAYGERRFYATDAQAGMAFSTALALTLVSLGLLATIPDGALTQLFSRPAPGALVSRRLLPWIAIGMPVMGWARLEGERRGLFGAALGTSIMVLAGSLLVTLTARLAAVSMDHLASALNHAWHEYGRASASEHSRSGHAQPRLPSPAAGDRGSITIEEDLEQAVSDG
jgi:hypothetical protein